MIDFKQKIAEQISNIANLPENKVYEYIEIPSDKKMGDFAFPCFRLAKELKKSPQLIAEDLKNKMSFDENIIDEINNLNGYLNFEVSKQAMIKTVLEEINLKQEHYGESEIGIGQKRSF